MKTRERFPELDLLRFLAACAVMLFHYTWRGPAQHVWPASFPMLGQIFRYGDLGVNVFFILSGFVILLTAYDKNALSFSIARFIRLYPAYWICLTLTTIAILLAGNSAPRLTPHQYLANLTMAHSYFGVRDVSGVYWTLAIELKFYFLIFVILAFRQARRIRYWLGLWLAASIFLSFQAPHGVARFFLFPEWSSYFIAGATFFLIYRHGPSFYKLFLLIVCYGLSICYATDLLPLGGPTLSFQLSSSVLVSLVTAFYLVFLWIALRPRSAASSKQPETSNHPAIAPGRGSRFLCLLGLITYPLYLIHQDIGYILLHSAPPKLNQYLVLGTVCCAAIGLAWLIHVGPEKWLARRLRVLLAGANKFGSLATRAVERARRLPSRLRTTPCNPVVPLIATSAISPVAPPPSPILHTDSPGPSSIQGTSVISEP